MIARIIKAEVCSASADNTNRGLDNFAIMRKLNPIIVLLYNYKCRSVETFHRTTTK